MDHLPDLLAAARGDQPCDLVLKGGRILNTFTGELITADVGIQGRHIAGTGSYRGKSEVHLEGRYVAPGFIEGHYHIESSLLRPSELVRIIVPRGTTCLVADPHEIANVAGLEGIAFLMDDGAGLPMDLFLMAPACVPPTEIEASGATITAREIEDLYRNPRVLGLGEAMDYHAVIQGQPGILGKIAVSGKRPVDGHAPQVTGPDLAAYCAAGPGTDHEATHPEEALEKARAGMTVMIRFGEDPALFASLLSVVNSTNCGQFLLVTDDRTAGQLDGEGHLDHILREAVKAGLDPFTAIRMVTLNTARYFGLKRRGAIAPGYLADVVILEDLRSFQVRRVYKAGREVARQGKLSVAVPRGKVRRSLVNTIHVKSIYPHDFYMFFDSKQPVARVMNLIPGTILTSASTEKIRVRGEDMSFKERENPGLDAVFVIERHRYSGDLGRGLVRGFGLHKGAMASSYAHDSHNLICVAADPVSASTAVNALRTSGGGWAIAYKEKLWALLELPIGGVLSRGPYEDLLQSLETIRKAVRRTGCLLPNPFYYLSFLSLVVVPELRITSKGLFDVAEGKFVGLEVGAKEGAGV